jgi:hypothetical protein
MSGELHGVTGGFATKKKFVAAWRKLRASGYTRLEANTPFAFAELEELAADRPTPIARIVLIAALVGAAGGYFLQWFGARDYPLNVGGRPVHSWPAFLPITFELTVLTAAIVGVGALFWLCGLPRLDHPVFAVAGMERATQDRLFLTIRADDPRFEPRTAMALLRDLGAETVEEVLA